MAILAHSFFACLLLIGVWSVACNNPEAQMTVPQIVAYHGYPAEEHYVSTVDGYILAVHRIPGGKGEGRSRGNQPKPVIYLQHGLLCSSADWVVNPTNDSLAFLLADAGFDVWMGNSRGNTYSSTHKWLDPDSDEYWAFSWDQMASYDLPAVVDFILGATNQPQIYYVGHSQGTMIAFAGFSTNQTLAQKIRKFYGLAPVAFLGHMESPLKYLSMFVPELEWLFKILGVRDFLPQDWLINLLARTVCHETVLEEICANVVFVICGFDKPQMNNTRLDVYLTHSPAGTSVQNIVHYAQAYKSGRFQKYDYGKEGNQQHYGQPSPPDYPISNFTIPALVFSGGNDWLADPQDMDVLLSRLPAGTVGHRKNIAEWMHLDFIWGMDAATLVYKDIITDAVRMEGKS